MPDKRENFDVDAARALLALAVTERAPDGPCPAPEAIAAWQARALSADDTARLDAHMSHCQRCLELWSGMLEATGVLEAEKVPARAPWPSLFPGRWRGTAVAATAVVVFAVAGVLLEKPAEQAPLAPYTLQIDDRMRQRGIDITADTVVNFGAGDAFALSARPGTAVEESVQVRLFIDSGEGPVPLNLPAARIARSGALQITGTIGRDVQLPEGASVLYVLVGRTSNMPSIDVVVGSLAGRPRATERHWTAWRLPLNVHAEAQR